jgi:site-specific recombinase XerD
MFKGSVYRRRWTYQGKKHRAWGIRYSVSGGPLTRKIVADTKDGSQAELDRIREDYKNRVLGVAEGKTLRDILPLFLTHEEHQGRDMDTIRTRLNNLVPMFGALALEAIDAEAIDGYIRARKAGGVENATINRDLSVLRNMLRLAVRKWKWLRQEPYFEDFSEAGGREYELSEAEEACLLPACSQELRDLMLGAIHTAMRQGELIHLTWAQVNLTERVIDFAPTKRGRKRLMPIGEPLYYGLARMRATQQSHGGGGPADPVFLRPDGRPWTKDTVEAHFERALRRAGIEAPLHWHDLRHTTSSRLIRRGANELEVQRLLGHTSVKTTHGYIHTETEDLRRVVNLLANPSTREAQEVEAERVGPSNHSE